eukprot:29767-Eustigmatos_ZCMA.PRE.1
MCAAERLTPRKRSPDTSAPVSSLTSLFTVASRVSPVGHGPRYMSHELYVRSMSSSAHRLLQSRPQLLSPGRPVSL